MTGMLLDASAAVLLSGIGYAIASTSVAREDKSAGLLHCMAVLAALIVVSFIPAAFAAYRGGLSVSHRVQSAPVLEQK